MKPPRRPSLARARARVLRAAQALVGSCPARAVLCYKELERAVLLLRYAEAARGQG